MFEALEGQNFRGFLHALLLLRKSRQMGDEPVINDDAGTRALIASVLKLALQDYANNSGCQQRCMFAADCPHRKSDAKHQDAKAFIHSDWCGALCDGVNVEHEEYQNACRKQARQECQLS